MYAVDRTICCGSHKSRLHIARLRLGSVYLVPSAHLSPYCKWQLDQFIHFCRAHGHQGCIQQTDRMTDRLTNHHVWLRSRVVSVLDSGTEGPGFKSQPRCCRVSLRQTLHTHCASVHQAAKLVAALSRVVGQLQAWRKVMAAYRRVYDSHHLQADCKEPGSAPEPYAL